MKNSPRSSGAMASLACMALFMLVGLSTAMDMSIIDYGDKHGMGAPSDRTEAEVKALYESWLVKHRKNYNALGEKERRFEIFKDNLRFVDEHNKQSRSYKVGLNRFADLTNEEYRSIYLGAKVDRQFRLSWSRKSNRYAYRAGDELPESVGPDPTRSNLNNRTLLVTVPRLGQYHRARTTAQISLPAVLLAVAHCLRLGVAHRDIKSDNTLFDGRDRLWLADFGSAETFGDGQSSIELIKSAKVFHYGSISLIVEPCRSAHLKAFQRSYRPNRGNLLLCQEDKILDLSICLDSASPNSSQATAASAGQRRLGWTSRVSSSPQFWTLIVLLVLGFRRLASHATQIKASCFFHF